MAQVITSETRFVGIIEDVCVAVGRVKHRVLIWVVKDFNLGVLLGRPYYVQIRLELKDYGDSSYRSKILSLDNK
jgi:hypothetical protein